MSDKDPLIEWNRLNKENAEQDLASALFISMANTSSLVDKFSMWLFAGTGATGALLIAQINSVLPNLTLVGFRVCMLFLIVSAIFAFCAKYNAIRCQIQIQTDAKFRELSEKIFSKHEESEGRILKMAKKRELEIQTEIDFENVISEFKKPFPFWVGWLISRSVKKTKGNRQAGYHVAIKSYAGQLSFAFWQSVAFVLFLCSGGWFASGL
ncbi:MAG: hypothetical protein JXA04_07980 [Gammaproteobacteria bacterium]|nr:hypothetical protein [Gammaproteobacteria bacterium]